jgi:hypothetical protein
MWHVWHLMTLTLKSSSKRRLDFTSTTKRYNTFLAKFVLDHLCINQIINNDVGLRVLRITDL